MNGLEKASTKALKMERRPKNRDAVSELSLERSRPAKSNPPFLKKNAF